MEAKLRRSIIDSAALKAYLTRSEVLGSAFKALRHLIPELVGRLDRKLHCYKNMFDLIQHESRTV